MSLRDLLSDSGLFKDATPDPNRELGPNDPLGRGGTWGLRDLLRRYFLPEFESANRTRSPIEGAFLEQTLEPGALYEAASTAATGKANELFKAGGQVSQLINRARGGAIQRGFNPESAFGDENVILRGATDTVANTFAQNAAALEGQRYSALTGTYGDANKRIQELIESIFTGVGSAEQLNLARNASRPRFLGIF